MISQNHDLVCQSDLELLRTFAFQGFEGPESPKVKNAPLRAYFCLAYFVILFYQMTKQLTTQSDSSNIFISAEIKKRKVKRPRSAVTNYLKSTASSANMKIIKISVKKPPSALTSRPKSVLNRPESIFKNDSPPNSTLDYLYVKNPIQKKIK
jgi:hypothetical protein